jgi:hypothetical protein
MAQGKLAGQHTVQGAQRNKEKEATWRIRKHIEGQHFELNWNL